MKTILAAAVLSAMSFGAQAAGEAITVYQDPNCGCCSGWVEHMRQEGFEMTTVKVESMAAIKQKLGVPPELGSCHTAVVEGSGQLIEGHVPADAVRKLLASPATKGVSAPGMPLNAPGMGQLDGTLITVDFSGRPFSQD